MKRTSNGIPLKRFYDDVKAEASNVPGYGVMSETITTVDNVTAYEFTARAMDSNVEEQFNIVLFEKKGFVYMIACGTRAPTYLSDEEENFDIIINTFKVQWFNFSLDYNYLFFRDSSLLLDVLLLLWKEKLY